MLTIFDNAQTSALRLPRSYILTTGSSTAYILSDPLINSGVRTIGTRTFAKFHATNGVTATINVNGTGVAEIRLVAGSAIAANIIPINAMLSLLWDGTYWIIENLGRPIPFSDEQAAEQASLTNFPDTFCIYPE